MKARFVLLVIVALVAVPASTAAAKGGGSVDYPRHAKPCRAGFVGYEDSRGRDRCHRRRATRLWYRLGLRVTFERNQPGGTLTHHWSQRWHWRSDHAVVLFRQCSLPQGGVPQPNVRQAAGLTPAVPCRLQMRGLTEDVSWGATGSGGIDAYERTTTATVPHNLIAGYVSGGPGRALIPCGTPAFESTTMTASPRFVADVGTSSQSAGEGGLSISFEAGEGAAGSALRSWSAIDCADPDPSVYYLMLDVRRPAGSQDEVLVYPERGITTDARFPEVARQFGSRRIPASKTVVRALTAGGTETTTYKLDFTRCPDGGRRARGC